MKRFLAGFASVVVLFVLVSSLLFAATLALRSVRLFNVPAGSMKPTLMIGDHFVALTRAYGLNVTAGLPLPPYVLFEGPPERGDVVVFKLPKDMTTIYVKRLIGLPGDRIQMIGGGLHINDQPVTRQRRDDFVETEDGRTSRIALWRETLPNGVSYDTLDLQPNGYFDNTPVYTVPEGHFFTLGDNRDNSTDSRVMSQIGYIPLENLVGKAWVIYWSRHDRFFTKVQ